jgi:tetratricopeptide (TPR) repeat protein
MTTRSDVVLVAALAAALGACSAPAPRSAAPSRSAAAQTTSARANEAQRNVDADARFKNALDLMKARQFEPARAAFLELSRDFPEFSGPLTNLGILYAQEKQRDAAVASLSRAVDANPRNAVALNWLGILYRESGAYARAEDAYVRALAARTDYAPATLNLAILYDVFLHRPDAALARYRDYQRLTGGDNLIVAAWIRDLESPAPGNPVATAGAAQ